MRLRWNMQALADREEIFAYIAADSEQSAMSVDGRIWSAIQLLLKFPRMGRASSHSNLLQLPVKGLDYVVYYRLEHGAIRIVRVLHGKKSWPN